MIWAFALTTTDTTLLLGLGYVCAGAAIATMLTHRGQPRAAALSALAVWPLLLPLLRAAPPSGPLSARIHAAFDGLARTLADPAADDVDWVRDLDALRQALVRADGRLALADRVLSEVGEAESLVLARTRAAAEITSVLDGVTELRLRVGLLALSGQSHGLRRELDGLLAQAAALEELERLDAPTDRPPLHREVAGGGGAGPADG